MNPILIFVLAFFGTSAGLTVFQLVLDGLVTFDIAKRTGYRSLSAAELFQEVMKRPLGRFSMKTEPFTFWWLSVGESIWRWMRRRGK